MTQKHSPVGVGQGRVLAGLIGRGILESRTPWMHEREAHEHGIHMLYSLFDFNDRQLTDDHLPKVLDSAEYVGFAGVNVTLPFKQQALSFVHELSDEASAIGAVNTIAFTGGRRIGYNTDVTGFADSFREGLRGAERGAVLQIGCGGAGAAAAAAMLAVLGVGKLILFDQDKSRAEQLVQKLTLRFGVGRAELCPDLSKAVEVVDGIVNATPMGMAKFPGTPIPVEYLESRHWVVDIVYFPLVTEFLAAAMALGCRTLDGSGMAVRQAAGAFEIFTGKRANLVRMHASFSAFVTQKVRTVA